MYKSKIEGVLAQAILTKVGKAEGVVEILEETEYSGCCETCYYEQEVFYIFVDSEQVYYSPTYGESQLSALNDWLTE